MSTKHKYSVSVIPDKEGEKFTSSSCKCKDCMLMHTSQLEWETFIPKTQLQKRMYSIISKIEKREKENKNPVYNIKKIPKRIKPDKIIHKNNSKSKNKTKKCKKKV